ncbi:MgpC family cytadherence protein [Mycoplasmoides genitalium]
MKLTYSSSGSNNISFENSNSQGEKPSYIVEFTNSTNVGIKWSVVKKYQLDVPSVSTTMNEVLQNLILEQPLTKYTLNSSLAKQKGKSQIEVHLGSNMATQWNTMRNSIGLNNNPSPNASTGFKLTTGNAYRKLSESWPIYQPIDGTKHGKGKDQSGWQSSEQSTAASDAPSVSGSGTSDSSKFQSYLNTKQALERIGILFDEGEKARNVITQLYYASTSKLAVTNDHVVVMGNSFLPSLWYWVVDRSATTDSSSKPTWFANTTLNWGENKQKQFVENQLGYKETTSTNSHNFHSKSFTQPAYFISGIDSVNDQIIFSGFKAGSVGYDSSSSSTKDQALAWSTTTSLDSKTGYRDLVTNDTGLNGPINGSFSIQDTFSFVVPYSGNHTNNGTTGPIKTAYPVKKSEASTVMINSLINATPLNSYGDEGVGVRNIFMSLKQGNADN